MKALFTFILFIISICSYSQTIEMTEATDEELLEYLKSHHYAFDEKQEEHYEKTRMRDFEYVIFYEEKPLYRRELLKTYYHHPHYVNHSRSEANLSIMFLFPIDDLDRETQLTLRENEGLKLLTGKTGKKYIRPDYMWELVTRKRTEDDLTKNFTLSPKVTIKIYKTILK